MFAPAPITCVGDDSSVNSGYFVSSSASLRNNSSNAASEISGLSLP